MNNTNKPLHLKYRPRSFEHVLGQEKIVTYFHYAFKYKKLAFAYLFVGNYGTGKTSIATIFTKSLNCKYKKLNNIDPCNKCSNCLNIDLGYSLDVYEINAAKNTGVDNIRDILEKLKFAPITNTYKICIFDEAHMLSNSAFNCLLKTLESPDQKTIFIFLTTEINKIPKTIISRCQKVFFKPLNNKNLAISISKIISNEKYKITNKVIEKLVTISNGSMRDALNLLEVLCIKKPVVILKDLETWLHLIPNCLITFFLKELLLCNLLKVLVILDYIKLHNWDETELSLMLKSTLNTEILARLNNCNYEIYKHTNVSHMLELWQILLTKKSFYIEKVYLEERLKTYVFRKIKTNSKLNKQKTYKRPFRKIIKSQICSS